VARSAPAATRLGAVAPVCTALVVLASSPPAPAAAQSAPTVVGVVAGGARTTLLWRPEAEAEKHTGAVVGAFADVSTPIRGLSVRAAATYTERGGDSPVDGSPPIVAGLRVRYLSVAIHAKLTKAIGPLRVHVAAGPTVDQVLSSALDPGLAQSLDRESPVVPAVTAGGGVGAWMGGGLFVGIDLRVTESLGDAYSGDFIDVRTRSVEALLHVAVPLSRLRPR